MVLSVVRDSGMPRADGAGRYIIVVSEPTAPCFLYHNEEFYMADAPRARARAHADPAAMSTGPIQYPDPT